MESFRCYDNSDVIATLMMTNFHLNTTVVAIFPNVCLWRHSLCSDLVLTLKNCTEPPSYATTAYVVAIWPSLLVDSFVKIWATYEMFLGKWFTAPPPPRQKISLTLMEISNRNFCWMESAQSLFYFFWSLLCLSLLYVNSFYILSV